MRSDEVSGLYIALRIYTYIEVYSEYIYIITIVHVRVYVYMYTHILRYSSHLTLFLSVSVLLCRTSVTSTHFSHFAPRCFCLSTAGLFIGAVM